MFYKSKIFNVIYYYLYFLKILISLKLLSFANFVKTFPTAEYPAVCIADVSPLLFIISMKQNAVKGFMYKHAACFKSILF